VARGRASSGSRGGGGLGGGTSSGSGLAGELHGENAELASTARMTKEMLDDTPDASALRSNEVVQELVAQLR